MLIPYGPMSISGGRIRTTPGGQIWTKQAAGRENVASFTNMGYRKLKVQVAPSSSQPIALLQINSPTCSGSRMSSTTTKPCSPWVNCCGAWPAKDCRIYERIQIHNTQVAFHADMSIHSSEMWPVLVPSSGKKTDQTGLFLDELKYHFCLLLSPCIPLWVANFTN